jgi:hypothetical protein
MNRETKEELLDLLYTLEDKHGYDNTALGLRIGNLINTLQHELKYSHYFNVFKGSYNPAHESYLEKCANLVNKSVFKDTKKLQ